MPAKDALAVRARGARRARRRDHHDGDGARLDDDAAAAARRRVRAVGDGSRDVARARHRARAAGRAASFVCNGDGSMLMNLGSLVSISGAARDEPVVHRVRQRRLRGHRRAADAGAERVDFAAIARGAGFTSVFAFDALECMAAGKQSRFFAAPGPRSCGCGSTRRSAFPGRGHRARLVIGRAHCGTRCRRRQHGRGAGLSRCRSTIMKRIVGVLAMALVAGCEQRTTPSRPPLSALGRLASSRADQRHPRQPDVGRSRGDTRKRSGEQHHDHCGRARGHHGHRDERDDRGHDDHRDARGDVWLGGESRPVYRRRHRTRAQLPGRVGRPGPRARQLAARQDPSAIPRATPASARRSRRATRRREARDRSR